MNIRVARNVLLVFGAASLGLWIAWLLFLPISTMLGIGENKIYTGDEARLRVVLIPLILGIPNVVGAVLAGFVLGWVTPWARFRSWAVGLIAVLVAVAYGPALAYGHFFAGPRGLLIHSVELIGTCLSVPVGLWLGRRVKSDGAVA